MGTTHSTYLTCSSTVRRFVIGAAALSFLLSFSIVSTAGVTVPSHPHRTSPSAVAQPARGMASEVVACEENSLSDGSLKVVSLRRVNGGKHPLIIVEDFYASAAARGAGRPTRRLEMAAGHMLVKLRKGATELDLKRVNNRHGYSIAAKLRGPDRLYLVSFPCSGAKTLSEAMTAYAKEADVVERAEPDYLLHQLETIPDDPRFPEQWGMTKIKAPAAWDVSVGGSVVTAVIDTGVDYTHDDLAPNTWKNLGEDWTSDGDPGNNGIDDDGDGYVDDYYGWNFYGGNNEPIDLVSEGGGHGTHCAGVIGAMGDNGLGVAGLNWSVKVMALKFIGPEGGYVSDAIEAVYYAIQKKAKVLSNSWGGGDFEQAMYDAIKTASDNGLIFSAAAGNDGTDNDSTPSYPASYDLANVISVAATDSRDELASFSNYGAKSVHIAAPGVDILSCYPGNSYELMSGTSMACPHISGACALLMAKNPDLTARQVKLLLMHYVEKVGSLGDKCVSGGRLDIDEAINGSMITVTAPNGGEAWRKGSTQSITWQSVNFPSTVKIDILKHGEQGMVIASAAPNTGSFSWSIPTTVPDGNDYQIRVGTTNGSVRDVSDSTFSISKAFVTLNVLGSGAGDVSPYGVQSVLFGQPLDIKASPYSRYYFNRWTTSGKNAQFADASASETTVTLSGNAIIAPVFEPCEVLLDEGFEDGLVPPTGWSRIDGSAPPDAKAHWTITSVHSHGGTFAAICPWGDGAELNEWLITPSIDLSNAPSPILSFWWESSYYWMVTNGRGALRAKISVDAGNTWTELWNFTGIGQWQDWTWSETKLDLSRYEGHTDVRIAFNVTGKNGSDVEIDDIALLCELGYEKLKIPRVTVNLDSSKANLDKITIGGAQLPSSISTAFDPAVNKLAFWIDGLQFKIEDGAWVKSGTAESPAYTFATKAGASPSISFKLDYLTAAWSATISRTSVYKSIWNYDGVRILIEVDGELSGNAYVLDETTSWTSFGKSQTIAVENGHVPMTGFGVGRGVGSHDNTKMSYGSFVITNSFFCLTPEEFQNTGVGLLLDGNTPLDGVIFQKQSGGEVFTYARTGTPNLNASLNLDTRQWGFSMSKGDCSRIDGRDGVDIRIRNGAYEGAARINVILKSYLRHKE